MNPFGMMLESNQSSLDEITADNFYSLLQEEKLIVFRNFHSYTKEQFLEYCQSFLGANLLQWSFGPVMEMKVTPDPKNYFFSYEQVPFHWDGAFYQEPSYLVFQCVEAPPPACGGETLFCDTTKIWEDASENEKRLWQSIRLSYETEKVAHYGGKITNALVQKHPKTTETILRFAEEVETQLNPVRLDIEGVSEEEKLNFLGAMKEKIYSPKYCYQHEWHPGDYLIADNFALIHARKAFKDQSARHLRRIQIL